MNFNLIKIGFGYDSHRFLRKEEIEKAKKGAFDTGDNYIDLKKPLILGGEKVKGDFPPFKARSDGDVITHAATNAILSALGKEEYRDIGTCFPPTNVRYTNKSWKFYLTECKKLLEKFGFIISDLKLTLKGKPRVDLSKVRENIANALEINKNSVLIQGTSGEDLGEVGKGLGVEVFAVCSLVNKKFLEKLGIK